MQTMQSLAALQQDGMRSNFRMYLESGKTQYNQYLNVSSTTDPQQQAAMIAPINTLYEIGDGDTIPYDTIKISNVVQAVDREFGGGFGFTERMEEDNRYPQAIKVSQMLGHAVNLTYEYRAASFLDDAFTGTIYKGVDGLALCHNAHTLLGSSNTYGNKPTSAIGMSIAGITALLDLAVNLRDENYDPIVNVQLDTLVCGTGTTMYNKALAILNSTLEPFTADNTDNTIKRRLGNLKLVPVNFMANRNWYFLVDSKLNDAHFVMRRKATFNSHINFNPKAILNIVTTRFLIWFVDWRGWFGTNPV